MTGSPAGRRILIGNGELDFLRRERSGYGERRHDPDPGESSLHVISPLYVFKLLIFAVGMIVPTSVRADSWSAYPKLRSFMDCSTNYEPQTRFRSQLRSPDYRSVITTALVARPFDEEALHDCMCTYVRAERDTGRSPSDVIVALTELVEQKGIASTTVRHMLVRRVIPLCVEAYFGARASDCAAVR